MSQIPFADIQAFSAICLNAAKPEDIVQPFDKALREVGIVSWFVGSMANVSEEKSKGFGYYGVIPKWQARYEDARHFEYDPVFQHALHGTNPIAWSQCHDNACAAGAGKRVLDIFAEASEFDLTDGYIIPVHGFGDLPGSVTLGGYDPDLSDEGRLSLDLINQIDERVLGGIGRGKEIAKSAAHGAIRDVNVKVERTLGLCAPYIHQRSLRREWAAVAY